jgi:Domain of unknown function (DUF3883)
MSAVPRFTPGRFTALWVVLRSVEKLGGTADREELLSFARRDGLRCGGLPIKDGYQLAVLGGFLHEAERVTATELGREALGRGAEDEPSQEVLRLFASALFLKHPPAWVAYWQGDPSSLDLVLPDTTRELLEDAQLLHSSGWDDLEAWALWDALKEVPPIEVIAEQRKAIGETAEKLSLKHERERLDREGYPALAARVRWVAQESAAYGFDILSFCGSSRCPELPQRPLAIEVKGQAVVARNEFNFYVTSHEWRTARTLGDRYLFHLWDGVRPGNTGSAARTEPFLVLPEVLEGHVPSHPKCGNSCEWKSAWVALPLPRN